MDPELGERRRESRVASEPDPVRVQHHELDPAALGRRQHVEDLRVDRRLASRQLDGLGLALGPHERVEHRLDLLEVSE